MIKKECRQCNEEFELDSYSDEPWYEYEKRGFCSKLCADRWDDAYDKYIDPLNWYRNPDRISTHD